MHSGQFEGANVHRTVHNAPYVRPKDDILGRTLGKPAPLHLSPLSSAVIFFISVDDADINFIN